MADETREPQSQGAERLRRVSTTGALCGHPTASGGTCQQPAGKNTDHLGYGHCRVHGGASPNGQKYGRRLMAEHALATYGTPIRGGNPFEFLQDELERTWGHVTWLHSKVMELDENDLVWGITKETHNEGDGNGTKPTTTTETQAEANIWLRLYQAERKAGVEVSRTMVACGIEMYKARLSERDGNMIAMVLLNTLMDLGVSVKEDDARLALRRNLELVAGEQVDE